MESLLIMCTIFVLYTNNGIDANNNNNNNNNIVTVSSFISHHNACAFGL